LLAVGLAFTAADVALVRNRRRLAQRRIDAYDQIPSGIRWLYRGPRSWRWQNEAYRAKHLWRLWLPSALYLAIGALLCLAAAVAILSNAWNLWIGREGLVTKEGVPSR
jgi:hypothetical protein